MHTEKELRTKTSASIASLRFLRAGRLVAALPRYVSALGLLAVTLVAGAGEIFTLDVCQSTPAHLRHDNQLIFPLKDGRLLMVWSEYYFATTSDAKPASLTDDMPCRISAKTSSDRARSWSESFVFQENTGKLNVKHPNLLRLPSGVVLFFYTEWNSRTASRACSKLANGWFLVPGFASWPVGETKKSAARNAAELESQPELRTSRMTAQRFGMVNTPTS